MKNKILITILFFLFISACSGIGTKRSDKSDEFLIEKKNPLVVPPDFDELPVPVGQEKANIETDQTNDIKKLLQNKQSTESSKQTGSKNLEESILKKINK